MSVPTLTDVKAQLNVTGTSQDDQLAVYLAAALKLIEARVGPSAVTSFTETVRGHGVAINLSHRPLVTVDSFTPLVDGYPSYDAADVEFDPRAGTVWLRDHYTLAGSWEVAYTAGWATFPDNYHLATLITVQHFWKSTRGGSGRPNQAGVDDLSVQVGGVSVTRSLRGQTLALPAMAEALISDGIYFGGIA